MYIKELVKTFEEITSSKYPELNNRKLKELLKVSLEEKKYDLQDQTFIETILKEDNEELKNSFIEVLDTKISNEAEKVHFEKEVVKIFIISLEHMVDYYYTSAISKHFSST